MLVSRVAEQCETLTSVVWTLPSDANDHCGKHAVTVTSSFLINDIVCHYMYSCFVNVYWSERFRA